MTATPTRAEHSPRGSERTPGPEPLGTLQATLLVAEREITTQSRSKSFVISLIVSVVLVLGGILLTGILGGGEDDDIPVAVVDVAAGEDQLEAAEGLETVAAGSEQEAEELLRDGEVEAIITSDEASPVGLHVIGLDDLPVEVGELLSVSPTMEALEEDTTEGPLRFIVGALFGAVFMMLAIGSGMMIVQNTIQEKQSRIVEILLSSISSKALLAGKILGNAALAIGQAVVLAAAAALGLMLSGQQELLDLLTIPMLWFVLFFVPGFVLVAAMFAAGASLVSRQEDSGAVITPTMMLIMAPYFVVIFFQDNPLIMTIASYVPFSAPVAMPVRMFFNEAQWFEPLLAMLALLVGTVLVMLLAAKIYSRSLLRTGQRVSLRTALGSGD